MRFKTGRALRWWKFREFREFFVSVQKQSGTFSLLLWTFSWVCWEKDNGCHNVVKTWSINLKTKTKKKLFKQKRFLDRTLHENTVLDRISVSLYISKALNSFSYENLSIFKAKLNKYFCPSLPENKIRSSTHHMHICSNFPVKQRRIAKKQRTHGPQAGISQLSFRCPVCCCAVPKSHNDIGVLLMSVTKLVLT